MAEPGLNQEVQTRSEAGVLSKSLRLLYVYALATGAIFTFMCYWDGTFLSYCGPGTFFAFGLMTLAIIPIAFVYAELSTMLPNVGAELVFNTIGLNKHWGFFSAWLVMMAWIAVPPAGTMGIISWINFAFNLNMSYGAIVVVSIIALTAWLALSLYKNVAAGQVQTFMLFAGLAGVLLTSVLYVISPQWSWSNFTPFFQTGLEGGAFKGWVIGLALIITPYFGFETVPQLVEEGTFPIKDQAKAILGSVLTCAAIYMIFYFAASGMAPWEILTEGGSGAPFITIKAFQSAYPTWGAYAFFLGVVGVLFPISTSVLGFWYSSVRLIYAMARQNFLPVVFAKTNKFDQPILPNILIYVISLLFIILQNNYDYIQNYFNLMAFACALAYTISSISAIRLAIVHPEWERPYKIPGGMFMRVLSLILAAIIAYGTALGQQSTAWAGLGMYIGIGILLWLWMLAFKWPKQSVWMYTPDGEKEF
ncbi:MAG: APC family permease [Zhaonellaceae bacterium]